MSVKLDILDRLAAGEEADQILDLLKDYSPFDRKVAARIAYSRLSSEPIHQPYRQSASQIIFKLGASLRDSPAELLDLASSILHENEEDLETIVAAVSDVILGRTFGKTHRLQRPEAYGQPFLSNTKVRHEIDPGSAISISLKIA